MARLTLKAVMLAIGCSAILVLAGYSSYQSLTEKSLKAEASVVLTFLNSLEKAYFTDSGRYAHFEQPYGAQVNGRENCSRPEGARELGFLLRQCSKDPLHGGMRYVYSVLPPPVGEEGLAYVSTAKSGSNIAGESLVCSDLSGEDHWQSNVSQKLEHTRVCGD